MREKRRIVVVDDEREIALGIALRLRGAGYDVQAAFSARAGLDLARGGPTDAIVLDLRMPEMDGFQLLMALKGEQATAGVPAIVVSANVTEQARTQALGLGAARFIEKPYQAEALLSAVAEVLRAAETPRAGPADRRD
ncbi:MAG TPA: response regulator [Phycisphaerae bacterium]|nr:response regulator [Phycisphaerae bacterium]